MSKLNKFYNDINNASAAAKTMFSSLSDEGKVEDTIDLLDASMNQYLDIWPDYSGNESDPELNDIKEHFRLWAINQKIKWEDLDDSSEIDEWLNIMNSGPDKLTGEIFHATTGEISDEKLLNITEKQYNSMLYEMVYLNDNDTTKSRTQIKTEIDEENINFQDGLPLTIKNDPQILEIKRNIVKFYVMSKSTYNESDVNTGLIFE